MPGNPPAASLDGIRVLELGHTIGGPFCGHLFATSGAEVIKVEPPGPAIRCANGAACTAASAVLESSAAQEVGLDRPAPPEGQALARELSPGRDILIENFRPGTLERWALGCRTCAGSTRG